MLRPEYVHHQLFCHTKSAPFPSSFTEDIVLSVLSVLSKNDHFVRNRKMLYMNESLVHHVSRFSHFNVDRNVSTAIPLVFIGRWCRLAV